MRSLGEADCSSATARLQASLAVAMRVAGCEVAMS